MDGINSNSNNGFLWAPSGVFKLSSVVPNTAVYSSSGTRNIPSMVFNLSFSNSIFGSTNTVQPNATQTLIIIKI